MKIEEAIRILMSDADFSGVGEKAQKTAEALCLAVETLGKSVKCRCESCKSYEYENNHCFHFDLYCEEDFYCKDWSEEE